MNKEKYLKELEKRLEYLKEEDKQKEIFRVSNELDNGKIANDLNKEVKDIYEKYNINEEKQKKKNNNKTISKLDNFSKKFNNFITKFNKKTFKEKVIDIKDILIIILIIIILKIPFIFVGTLLDNFSKIIPIKLINILNYGIELLYIVFAIYYFLKIFKRRFKEELK